METSCVALPADFADGTLPPVAYGSEQGNGADWNSARRCHDCDVSPGGFHHPGCDMEECPRCHQQLLSCDCERPDADT
jgi:hypothetical protein